MNNKNKKPILVLVAGPSGSGKTTLSNRVIEALPSNMKAVIVSQDDFYHEKNLIPKKDNTILNYDHPDAFDWKLIKSTINDLMNTNKEIKIYRYDFTKSKRTNDVALTIKSPDLIIFEGLYTLYDEEIKNMANLTVFVETELDECIIRRIKRDIHERKRDIDDIIYNWREIVKPMYKSYVEPQKYHVDVIIPWDEKKLNSIKLLTNGIIAKKKSTK